MLLILIIFLPLLYFLPAIIAKGRRHNNATAVFFTDLLLGWTVLGWIVAFIWAMTANVKDPTRGMSKSAVLAITLTILTGAMFIVLVLGAHDYPS
jgi:heme/copper-type cytochrome/quinol oxidase subunit 2